MPPAKWFKPVAMLITIWMAMGLLMIVFGIATFGGLCGGVALVKRSRCALPFLTISLAAVTVQFGYTTLGMHALEALGPAQALGLPITVFVMGALSLWVGIRARNEGWLS